MNNMNNQVILKYDAFDTLVMESRDLQKKIFGHIKYAFKQESLHYREQYILNIPDKFDPPIANLTSNEFLEFQPQIELMVETFACTPTKVESVAIDFQLFRYLSILSVESER